MTCSNYPEGSTESGSALSNRDGEFTEFFSVTWPRVYRTAYAVAGRHVVARSAVKSAYAGTYDARASVFESGDPEAEVTADAIRAVITAIKKTPETEPSAAPFGPLTPNGALVIASPEERSRVDSLWAELQALDPEDRAAIALAAAATSAGQAWDADNPPVSGRLVEFLVANLDEVLIYGADLEAVMAQGSDRKRRRRWVTGAVVAVLVAAVAIPVALFAPQQKAVSAKNVGVWREVASAPLSPRLSTLATWTGTEALFWGGTVPDCIRDGSCGPATPRQSQGVAYDPASQTWRRLADAPFDADGGVPHIQVNGQFLVEDANLRWWSFVSDSDRWIRLPDPPEALVSTSVTSQGPLMYALGNGLGDQVQVFDTNTNRWSSLPPSPNTPKLADRILLATPAGLVAIGRSFGESPDGNIPIYRVEFFDGQDWNRIGDKIPWATLCCWHWTGARLLVPDVAAGLVPSLEKVGVPAVTMPESSQFPPPSRTWSQVVRSGPMLAWSGNVYDDRDQSTGRLGRPFGAPEDIAAAVWADHELIVILGQNPTAHSRLSLSPTSRVWVATVGE